MEKENILKCFENEILPTNIYVLDHILKGGLELGSSIQLVGESMTGKSTIMLNVAKNICASNKKVLYIDTENSISREMIIQTGIVEYLKPDNKKFYYYRLSTFEEVEKKLDEYILNGDISFAGLINSGYTKLKNGISIAKSVSSHNSRPLGMFMNKYKTLASKHQFVFFFTNQNRNKINTTGTILKEYGGKNIRYNSDVIIKVTNQIDKEFKPFAEAYNDMFDKGAPRMFELIKSNKLLQQKQPFFFVYARGISNFCNYVYALKKTGNLTQAGTYYSVLIEGTELKGNGIKNLMTEIKGKNIDIYKTNNQIIDDYYQGNESK